MATTSYHPGDVIEVQMAGYVRHVRVTTVEDDVKNGRPGFDGVVVYSSLGGYDERGDEVWGYDDQVVRVIP